MYVSVIDTYYIHVYVYIYMQLCMTSCRIYIDTYLYAYTDIILEYMYAFKYIYMYNIYMDIYMYAYTYLYMNTFIIYIYTLHVFLHTYIYLNTFIIYICMFGSSMIKLCLITRLCYSEGLNRGEIKFETHISNRALSEVELYRCMLTAGLRRMFQLGQRGPYPLIRGAVLVI